MSAGYKLSFSVDKLLYLKNKYMRTTIFYIFLVLSMTLVSCDRNNSVSTSLSQSASSGSWRLTLFTDNGNDETADFSGYTFTFSNNGTLTVVKNGISKNGSWSVNTSSNKFIIELGPKDNTNLPLGELTNDWKILSTSTTEIRLGDDNTTSNEFVTFTKN